MIVKKDPGSVMVGKGELHGIFGAWVKICGAIEKGKGDKSAVFVHWFGIDNGSVDGPYGTRNEKRIDGIVTYCIDIREHGTAGRPTYFEARDFPAICRRGGAGDKSKQKNGEEHGQDEKENHSLGGHDHLPAGSADRRNRNVKGRSQGSFDGGRSNRAAVIAL